MRTNVRGLTEAALLTGLSVVLYLMTQFIPVAGGVMVLFSPVPLVILEMRHDLRTGLVSLLAGAFLVMLISGPISALSYAFGFAAMALALGRIIELKTHAVEIVAWGSLVSLASKLALAIIMFYVTGINPLKLDMPDIMKVLDMAADIPGFGMSPEARAQAEQAFRMLPMLMPAAFIDASVIHCLLCYWVSGKFVRRLYRIDLPKLPPFTQWRFPLSVLWAFFAAFLFMVAAQFFPPLATFAPAAMNVQFLVQQLFLLQGVSFAAWWLERKSIRGAFRGALLVLIFMMPLLNRFAEYAGMFDMYLDLRVRLGRRD